MMAPRPAVWNYALDSMNEKGAINPKILQQAFEREQRARKRAEELLESKSHELYQAHERLKAQHDKLLRRNEQIERAHAELTSTQAQLVQSEKMASVGQLAAGVAHEINNPVGFIKSNLSSLSEYAEVLKKLLDLYKRCVAQTGAGSDATLAEIKEIEQQENLEFLLEDIDGLIEESYNGTVRVKDIVQGLKSFSRVDDNQAKHSDINAGLDETVNMVWNELKYKCEIEKCYSELPPVECNPGQLNQVFMNLLINAAQAIEEQGTITITTQTLDKEVAVEIRDTGAGIAEENLKSIFDPFFTTKEVGVGTGLGLSISYGIIKNHGGSISVSSKLGEGTAFLVKLPCAASSAAVAKSA